MSQRPWDTQLQGTSQVALQTQKVKGRPWRWKMGVSSPGVPDAVSTWLYLSLSGSTRGVGGSREPQARASPARPSGFLSPDTVASSEAGAGPVSRAACPAELPTCHGRGRMEWDPSRCRAHGKAPECLVGMQVPRLRPQKLQGLGCGFNSHQVPPKESAAGRNWHLVAGTFPGEAAPSPCVPNPLRSHSLQGQILLSTPHRWPVPTAGPPPTARSPQEPPELTQEKPMQPMAPHSMSASMAGYELAVGK